MEVVDGCRVVLRDRRIRAMQNGSFSSDDICLTSFKERFAAFTLAANAAAARVLFGASFFRLGVLSSS